MGFVYGIGGDQGKPSTPMDMDFAYMKQAVHWNPDTLSKSKAIAFNGKMKLEMSETDYKVKKVGSVEVPNALVFVGESTEQFVERYLDGFATKVFKRIGLTATWKAGNSKELGQKLDGVLGKNKPLSMDLKYESTNVVPNKGAIMYYDRSHAVVAVNEEWLDLELNAIQRVIQNEMEFLKLDPQIRNIGFGLFQNGGEANKGGFTMVARPNFYTRISPVDIIRAERTTFSEPQRAMKIHAYYTYLVAIAMWAFEQHVDLNNEHWISKLVESGMLEDGTRQGATPKRTIHDYVAFVEIMLFGLVGIGDTKVERHWTATDIASTVKHAFGLGYTQANRRWWNMEDMLNWSNYWQFCTLLAFAMERVRPSTMQLEINRVTRGQKSLIGDFNHVNHGNYPSMGSISGIHFHTPTNSFKWKGENTLPIPVIMDEIDFEDATEAAKYANNYRRLRLEAKPQAFGNVTVTKGEIPADTIDWTSHESKRFTLTPTNDARILQTRYTERDILRYIFPTYGMLVTEDEADDRMRRHMYLAGLMANGSRTPSEGVILGPNMQLFASAQVDYFTNRLGEKIIDKKDTETTGLQEPKATAGMTGGQVDVKTEVNEQGQPPHPKPAFEGRQQGEPQTKQDGDATDVSHDTKSESDGSSEPDPTGKPDGDEK